MRRGIGATLSPCPQYVEGLQPRKFGCLEGTVRAPAFPIHDGVVLCLEGKCGVLLGRGAEERLTCDLTGTRNVGPRSNTYAKSENSFGVS